jgi:uncharacterized protein YecE (DUF72 family)
MATPCSKPSGYGMCPSARRSWLYASGLHGYPRTGERPTLLMRDWPMPLHAIQLGTSGWSYGDWVGPFYPPRITQAEYLNYYATQFGIVEVDRTFYRTPSRTTAAGWAARTPDHFRFALKVPQVITHEKVLRDCDDEMDDLLAALEPLRPKVKCLLLQFGYLNRAAFASDKPFLERLDGFLGRYAGRIPLAVEIRNKNWLTGRYFDLLRRHGVVATLVEHAWLPPLDALIAAQDVVTGPFSYVRLIGDREGIEKVTKTWGQVVVDRSADLRRLVAALRQIATRAEVMVFINNHYAGHGPASCRQLEACLAAGE